MTMTDEQELFTAATLREHQEGHGHREPDMHEWAGIVRDPQVSRYLARLEEVYDPRAADRPDKMPGRASELSGVRSIVRMASTEAVRDALDSGDYGGLKHLVGDSQQQADVSGIKAIEKVRDLVTGPAPVIVILGEMGAGKTDFAGLLGQIWKANQPSDALVASNVRTLRETTPWVGDGGDRRDGWIADFGELEEWVQQDGDPLDHLQRPKLFFGDEFSSEAGGSGKSGHLTRERMGPLVYKIRKFGGTLFYIGHGERSISPALWRVGKVVKKVSKKKAVVADGITASGKLKDIEMEIEGIPPTDWRFDTNEASSWSWAKHGSDADEYEPDEAARDAAIYTAIRCKEGGLTNRKAAEYVPYSREWVGTRWREHRDEGMHEETLARVEEVIA